MSGALQIVERTSQTLGTTLPAALDDAVIAARALVAAAADLGDGGPQALHAALIGCLRAGKDPLTDKAVAKAMLAHTLSTTGIREAVRQVAEHEIEAALSAHADELLASWSGILAPHLDTVTAAASVLPDNLDDIKAITAMGTEALAHWANVTEANRLVCAAVEGASTLLRLGRVGSARADRRVMLLTAGATPEVTNEIMRETQDHPSVWTLARHGVALSFVDSVATLLGRLECYDVLLAVPGDVSPVRHTLTLL